MKIKNSILLFLLSLVMISCSSPYDQAIELYKKKDYKNAYDLFLQSANKGNDKSQYYLGLQNAHALGIDFNLKKALSWYQKSANQGNIKAKAQLISFYLYGQDDYLYGEILIKKDVSKALELIKETSAADNPIGNYYLALVYKEGEIIDKDPNQSFELFEKATKQFEKLADLEDDIAQLYLAAMYKGIGIEKDLNKSLDLYKKSANNGNINAMGFLAWFHKKYNETEISKLIKKDPKERFYWVQKIALRGHPDYQNKLGNIYFYGNGVEKSYLNAFDWYFQSSQQGHIYAKKSLADLYFEGKGTNQNFEKAAQLYQEFLNKNQDSISVKERLAQLYLDGLGIEKDYEKAIVYLKEVYDSYNSKYQEFSFYKDELEEAKANLLHAFNKDEKDGLIRKFNFYNKLAEEKNLEAMQEVSNLYKEGLGVKQNYEKAIEWQLKLIDQIKKNQGTYSNKNYLYQSYIKLLDLYKLSEKNYSLKELNLLSDLYENFRDYESAYKIAEIYENGYQSINKDYFKAMDWYEKITGRVSFALGASDLKEKSKNKLAKLQFKIAQAYEEGNDYLEKNYSNALDWYKKVTNKYSESTEEQKKIANQKIKQIILNTPCESSDITFPNFLINFSIACKTREQINDELKTANFEFKGTDKNNSDIYIVNFNDQRYEFYFWYTKNNIFSKLTFKYSIYSSLLDDKISDKYDLVVKRPKKIQGGFIVYKSFSTYTLKHNIMEERRVLELPKN